MLSFFLFDELISKVREHYWYFTLNLLQIILIFIYSPRVIAGGTFRRGPLLTFCTVNPWLFDVDIRVKQKLTIFLIIVLTNKAQCFYLLGLDAFIYLEPMHEIINFFLFSIGVIISYLFICLWNEFLNNLSFLRISLHRWT